MRASLGLTVIAATLVGGSLSACSSLNTGMKSALEPETACSAQAISVDPLAPEEAAVLVRSNPGHCQPGTFAMTVRSIGRSGSVLYLNSGTNPYDYRNLSIAVLPVAQKHLATQLQGHPEDELIGKRIVVEGTARSVAVVTFWSPGVFVQHYAVDGSGTTDFYPAPRPSLGQPRQSHVLVKDADQMMLVQAD
jgi:hypothetical protein